ncbi:hypothetical protein SAMN05443574_14011 [Haloarcula vallismortis]|uniref:Uncharacterized protein n=3 Tax=Haloarcula vallismortis TaxID=28442 RepID=M0JCS0_HALVA|nr:hypothetical protein C437_12221 [Haloarcula vallismortis ATCC 29715]SDX38266.1 hypothetical protein SAMN05443574_14011 [Haloarcula vallismortis]
MSTLVFLMGVLGGTNFLNSLYSNHGVQSNVTEEVNKEYREYEETYAQTIGTGENQDEEGSLYNEIVSRDYTGIEVVDQAVAGVLVVPKFVDLLTTPIQIIDSVVSGLENSPVGRYLPGFVWSGVRIGFYATLLYSVFSLIIGMRS